METASFLPINADLLSELKLPAKIAKGFTALINNGEQGIVINSFKAEQKIVQFANNANVNFGGFVNGSSKIKNFKIRYLLVLYSNKYVTIKTGEGTVIRKRYGYGFGFTINVSNIDTKVGFNFGLIAASASLNLATAGYETNVYGVVDANLAKYLPTANGDFTLSKYAELQKFILETKKTLKLLPININSLYPIEILSSTITDAETDEIKSIYFGALKVSKGVKLNDAIVDASNHHIAINENVLQFIYNYFEVKNAYVDPDPTQKGNAQKWIEGKYNKKEPESFNGTWVAIDPSIEGNNFVALSQLSNVDDYRPHPVPLDWATVGKRLNALSTNISLDFSSSLRIASIIDSSYKFNTQCITQDIALYLDVFTDPPEGTKIIETRYGVGIRFSLRISGVEFGTKVNFNTIGAASELNQANVEFEMSGIGISDTSLFDLLPIPQDINQKSISDLNASFENIQDILANMDVSKFNPQPFQIRVQEPENIDPTLKAQSVVFAIREIAQRTSLKDVINAGLQVGADEAIITDTYKSMFNIADKPTKKDRDSANSWLTL